MNWLLLLVCIISLGHSCSNTNFNGKPRTQTQPIQQNELVPSEEVKGKVSEESESIAGYSLVCQEFDADSDSVEYGCLIAQGREKADLDSIARTWSWGYSFYEQGRNLSVEVEEQLPNHRRWHVIYRFFGASIADSIVDDVRIEFSGSKPKVD